MGINLEDGSKENARKLYHKKKMLHLSDVHLNYTKSEVGSATKKPVYGEDAPLMLLDSILLYARAVVSKPDIFIYTGDSVYHSMNLPHFEEAKIREIHKTNTHKLREMFKDVKLIATMTGNSDATPEYSMEITHPVPLPDPNTVPDQKTGTEKLKPLPNPTLTATSGSFKDILNKEELEQFEQYGYNVYPADEKLIVITLNTAPYSIWHTTKAEYEEKEEARKEAKKANKVLLEEPSDIISIEDPFHQFLWLTQILEKARKEGKKAYICGHIPPIVDSWCEIHQWKRYYIKRYRKIVKEYSDVVAAQIFAHLHSQEMRIPSNTFHSPLFSAAAISQLYWNNPAFIVWEYDAITYELHDFVVHGSNISHTNPFFEWKELFRATEAYGLKDLSTKSLQAFRREAELNDTLIERYYRNSKGQSYNQNACDTVKCRAGVFCSMRWWNSRDEYMNCIANQEIKLTILGQKAGRAGHVEEHKATSRILLPATEDGHSGKPVSTIPETCVIVCLTFILLGVIILVLGKIFGMEARWTRYFKGRRPGEMKTIERTR
uniref:Calcineurinlike phosphoesterase putative n=1 Tax=Albugo laibachii Nc14 TaxID=890382 RepID=F0WAL1_9STRA|nr:calcineurinlike phosphoesterase putative [Albugo laibachii Nc14]|eukprot:CCA18182.1 calcineurinlike phosphoesterase putative [Albugo laibachii Nc14]